MKTSLIAFLLCTALPMASHATTETYTKAVKELFRATGLEKMTETSIEASAASLAQQTDQPEKARPALEKFLRETVGFRAIEGDMVKVYQKYFTENEIREILKFYASPAGRKMVANQMALVKEGAVIGQAKIAARQKDLQKIMQTYTKKK